MTQKISRPERAGDENYREETIRLPAVLTLLLVALIAAPLVYWMVQINREGTRTSNVSQYTVLVDALDSNVKTVDAMLRNDTEELAAALEASRNDIVTMIVPEIIIIEDEPEPSAPKETFDVKLDGIYWSPSNPLVGLSGETYRVGDRVQGYEIIQIGKSKVRLHGPDDEIVIMDMNEKLRKFK
ncbi:hypothetical protein P4B35_10660 [Pontiellaceae bacterium B12227]|nr:hypothetical protein [Pontiellaceae bacterium B12227]